LASIRKGVPHFIFKYVEKSLPTEIETFYKVFSGNTFCNLMLLKKNDLALPEITAKIFKLKCRVWDVGISYYLRTYEEEKTAG
jgi:hypothetical protein